MYRDEAIPLLVYFWKDIWRDLVLYVISFTWRCCLMEFVAGRVFGELCSLGPMADDSGMAIYVYH